MPGVAILRSEPEIGVELPCVPFEFRGLGLGRQGSGSGVGLVVCWVGVYSVKGFVSVQFRVQGLGSRASGLWFLGGFMV